ncbi:cupin family protein [Abeliophyllum distichum]|uniref:Cupin family protein n=1 Tax=Abeliophyllum distichum TaxID=126358 RepID=A0ABD1RIG9_9LAMI
MKDLGNAKKILGMDIIRDISNSTLMLKQQSYIMKILKKFSMHDSKAVSVPLANHFMLSKDQCPQSNDEIEYMNKVPYSNVIGSVMYTMICTRPDIAYSLQHIVALSTTESEYVAITKTVKEVLWLKGTTENDHLLDPQQRYKQCQRQCARQEHGQGRQYCQQQCEKEYKEQQHEQPQTGWGKQEQTNNPNFFDSQRFDSKYRTEEGHIKALERFSKRSRILQGIENYRLAILEANPSTFVVPNHCDAESVLIVVHFSIRFCLELHTNMLLGHILYGDRSLRTGTITYVWKDQRKSFNLKSGGVLQVPAGSTENLINGHNERLYILRLLQPVKTPGHFETPRDKLDNLFRQQKKGVIIRASQEQIRALTQQSGSEKGESWGPWGGMIAPHYNSRTAKIVFVVGGSGRYEMACPHLGRQSQQGSGQRQQEETTSVHYQKASARLSVGDAFVFPVGHPIAIIASQNSNLQLAEFGIKAWNNQICFLAGQDNIWNQIQSEAKELSFKLPTREVDEIFRSQDQSYFLPGPEVHQKRGEEMGHSVASILDFAGF